MPWAKFNNIVKKQLINLRDELIKTWSPCPQNTVFSGHRTRIHTVPWSWKKEYSESALLHNPIYCVVHFQETPPDKKDEKVEEPKKEAEEKEVKTKDEEKKEEEKKEEKKEEPEAGEMSV